MNNNFLGLSLWVLSFLLIPQALPAQTAVPNIVLVLVDDMGVGDSRAYNPASQIPMPNLERLASEGLTFDRAYTAAPKCAPTRYSLMSGNYQWRGRFPYGQWNYKGGSEFLPGQMTIAAALQDAGYFTSIVGKYHLGADFYLLGSNSFAGGTDPEDLVDFGRPMVNGPLDNGFDHSFTLMRGGQKSPYAYFENDLLDGQMADLINWQVGWYFGFRSRIINEGIGLPDYNSSEIGPMFIEQALAQLSAQSALPPEEQEPLFLYFPTFAAHFPHTPPDFLGDEPIRNESGLNVRSDMILEVDAALGLLMDNIEQNGRARDTLIIVASDNGAAPSPSEVSCCGHDRNNGLRGGKGEIWEGGVRIPLIMRWGDGTVEGSTIPPNSTSDMLVGLQDLPATLVAVAGVDVPAGQFKDSYSILPEILDPGTHQAIRTDLVLEARERDGQVVAPHYGIVSGSWKLVLDSSNAPEFFFDLSTNREETTNLIDESALQPLIAELTQKLLALRSGISDSDGDGFLDDTDNCTDVANPGQEDFNGDLIGDICDADVTGPGEVADCFVNFLDLQKVKDAFFSNPSSPGWDEEVDFDNNGAINFGDLQIVKNQIFSPPGPSAAGCN